MDHHHYTCEALIAFGEDGFVHPHDICVTTMHLLDFCELAIKYELPPEMWFAANHPGEPLPWKS